MSVIIDTITLPDQTLFSAEHLGLSGITDVAHSITGKPFVFMQQLKSRPATLAFNEELAWLTEAQKNALVSISKQLTPVQLSVRGKAYSALFNHSANDGAVQFTPVMPFCDKFSGTINLIILE